MYDYLNKIGIKIMLEAVKSKFPETLPASGGNADKLDGLHAASFLQNTAPVALTTSINDMTTAGTYGVYSETPDLPTGYGNWGFLEVRRFGLLCYQTIIFDNGVIISRGRQTNGGDWVNWQRVNDNGNADTVDGLHADDFVKSLDQQFDLPSNVDVPTWISQNAKLYTRYRTYGNITGLTNVPNNSGDYVWYWYDGLNILAREYATGRYYISDMINGGFSGWKDVYTSGFKPYVTGEVTGTSGSDIITTNHGFTPSAVFWWMISQGRTLRSAYSFGTTSFQIPSSLSEDALVNYIIFK